MSESRDRETARIRRQRALELRSQGLLVREIAAALGVAKSTANQYVADPDGAKLKARKQRYRGRCADCGASTDGSDGPGRAAKRCAKCVAIEHQHETRQWTPERIVTELQAWARQLGRAPTALEAAARGMRVPLSIVDKGSVRVRGFSLFPT